MSYYAQNRLMRNQNLVRTQANVQAGPISVSFMLVALVAILSLLYLNQVTKATSLNYRLSSLQSKRTELQAQKEQLQIDAARLSSIAAAKTSEVAQAYTTTTNVNYSR